MFAGVRVAHGAPVYHVSIDESMDGLRLSFARSSIGNKVDAAMSMKYSRVRRDRILFVGVKVTCWDGPPPAGQVPEIIEFGIAEVDVGSLALVRSGSILVRLVASTVSPYCTRLTGLDHETLDSRGLPFREAAATLRRDWETNSKAWMSWGYDRAPSRSNAKGTPSHHPSPRLSTTSGFSLG
jgi:hypothetical protein